MDVKSAFLYGTIDEEVYVSQPLGFVDPKFPKKVYKVVKALYGLHQAPRAWNATLSTFLLKSGYRRGTIDKTLFIKKDKNDIMLVQVYVDDIIFGSTKEVCVRSVKTVSTPIETQKSLTKDEEAADVDVHLYRSMIGSLMYLTASRPDIMYLKGKPKMGLWYPRVSSFDLEAYSDGDYAGANLDRKSTTRGCQFLGRRLISWQCKKQTIVATSTTEAEYVAAANCCGQVLKIHTDDNVADLLTKAFDVSSLVNPVRSTLSTTRLCWCCSKVFNYGVDAWIGSKMHFGLDLRAVVVTEASIRSSLLLHDADGTACLTNEAIFQNLALMGNLDTFKKKFLMYPRFLMVFLNNQIELGEPFNDVYVTPAHTQKVFSNMSKKGVKFLGKVTPLFDFMLVPHQAPKGEGDQPLVTDSSSSHNTTQDSMDSLEDTNGSEGTQVQSSHDSPLSGDHTSEKAKGGLNLEDLFVLCTNLSNRVLALETSKDAQATEILKLKDQIKKLKRKCKPSISHHRAWLKSVKRLSMKKRDYMETEDVVKEGMQSNETEELNKGNGAKGGCTEELVSTAVPKIVSTARPELSTARLDVDAARQEDSVVEPRTPPTTTSIFDDEDITIAQTLIKMKEEKAKEKGESIKDIEDSSRPTRSILTLKTLLTIDPINKGKSVLEEPEPIKKMTISRKGKTKGKKASKATIAETYDEVQVGIDGNALFVAKLQQEEREEYTIEEIAKFLVETIAAQRKFRAAQRSAEIRSLYERQKRVIDDFKPMDSDDAVKDSKEAAGVHKQKVLEEPNSTKVEVKQEGHEEKEEQLKAFLKIVPDEEGIIDYEVLEKRFPIINWESKFYDFDRHGAECIYYRIFRSDGSSRWIKTFSEMVTRFDRLDLVELYNLVMKRFETTTPEGVDLVLWGDLRTMFDANAEDELWQNQERWNLKSWDLYENCGVHTLILEDGTEIHMLAERKYPLTKETLERMLSLRLVAGTASEDAYTLLRFIQKQIDEYGSHDGEQTTSGKDFSNPLMADSLPKTIWFSTHHAIAMKHWLFQSKRLLLLRCCKDDKDWKLMNVKYYKVTKEFKFIKEQIKE
ncbi:putative ribonuclease H-like domain-containing protein [Tanacetum coccineum]